MKGPKSKKKTKRANNVGDTINFRGVVYAPMYEPGVILLFGKVAHDLNFKIERVTPNFPDCIARRYTGNSKNGWQKVRIEFEYKSSNFFEHKHDPGECDIIVCWEHDWEDCPAELEVIALRECIKELDDYDTQVEPKVRYKRKKPKYKKLEHDKKVRKKLPEGHGKYPRNYNGRVNFKPDYPGLMDIAHFEQRMKDTGKGVVKLAEEIGLNSHTTLSNYIRGHRKIPMEVFRRLAKALRTKPHKLIRRWRGRAGVNI